MDICKFGIDIPTKEELIMNKQNESDYSEEVGFKSLKYLDLDTMKQVIGNSLGKSKNDFCVGCFGGGYESKLLDW